MSVQYLLSALALGFVVAIPPGSVTVVACQRALQHGYRNSLVFTLGSSLSDTFYLALVFIGVANVIASNQYLKVILWFVSAAVLAVLGVTSIAAVSRNPVEGNPLRLRSGTISTFVSGILVTLTNPWTIVGWMVVAGNFYLVWSERTSNLHSYSVVSIAAIMTGVLLWILPLTYIVSRARKVLTAGVTKTLVIISSICLFGFGAMALYYACTGLVALASGGAPE